MNVYSLLMLFCSVSAFMFENYLQKTNPLLNYEQPLNPVPRPKREAVGSLDIITNNADPIHADVKSENVQTYTEKPCPKAVLPSMIESGVGFKVTPPSSSSISSPLIDLSQSRRKLHPFSNTLEIIRTVSRLILLLVLLASAVIEFYPIISNMFQMIYNLIYL